MVCTPFKISKTLNPLSQRLSMAPKNNRLTSKTASDRSAFFARREAAAVLKKVLHGDASRLATSSIKSLIFGPTVRNKKATFALVCETLKYLPILKKILEASNILNNKWKKQEELVYVVLYDILFGQEAAMTAAVEKFLLRSKNALQIALAKLLVQGKTKNIEDLLPATGTSVCSKPRYVRVNTLKMDVEIAIRELQLTNKVSKDDTVPGLLVLPSGTDLHDHPLVSSGNVFLQGKASSMVAVALGPEPGWKVLDACAAPGNKTVHLAALMKGKGDIIACELHEERAKLLEDTIKRAGASNIDVVRGDFMKLDPYDSQLSEVRAILLDPSCSGSGIATERLDHLLPSYNKESDGANSDRVKKLSGFQRKALTHALSFPGVERVVYSTCSIHQAENEDVVNSVLPTAKSLNFELAAPFPKWPRRGLPVFEGAENLLRTDPKEDTEGFFIALFVRKPKTNETIESKEQSHIISSKRTSRKRKKVMAFPLSKMLLHNVISNRKRCRTL